MNELINSYYNIDFSSFKDKKVLITGASGLVGIHLLSTLKKIQKQYNITIYTWNKNENNLFSDFFVDCEKIVSDITDLSVFEKLPKFDFIIHSSGYGQPGKFLLNKIKTIEINTISTIKLLEKLDDNGTFLFISSSEVYNGLFKYNIHEDEIGNTDPFHPRSSYIEGKRCGESICNIYRESGKNVKIVRLSFSYGPGTQYNDTRVIGSIIDKGLNNDYIELSDDGRALRTLCYITDAIEMIWNILLHGKQFVYNVGGVDTLSILELSQKIGYILNKEIKLPKDNNGLIGNPKLVNLSLNRYFNEFGKKQFVSLNEGLLNTINWQKNIQLLVNENN